MNNIVQDKMAREIMVVSNESLFKDIKRETKFYKNDDANFEEIILEQYEFMVRGEAEINTLYKQPISYAVVINNDNKVFVYKRGGKDSNVGDMRFQSFISFGIGGHIEREDEDSKNLLKDALKREVEEELNISESNIESLQAIGYINDDSAILHEVHIGVVYLVKVKDDNFALLDGELENGEFVDFSELEMMIKSPEYEVENWSNILFEPLKEYFNS